MFKTYTTLISLAAIFALADSAMAAGGTAPSNTKATYRITGLHCPACTTTIESSLSKAKGVNSIKVDWTSKLAQVEFDESVAPAQRVAQLIAATPHMMGKNLHYDGLLVLKSSGLKDPATAAKAKETLANVAGIKSVEVDPARQSMEVQFDAYGKVTTQQLIDALSGANITATNH